MVAARLRDTEAHWWIKFNCAAKQRKCDFTSLRWMHIELADACAIFDRDRTARYKLLVDGRVDRQGRNGVVADSRHDVAHKRRNQVAETFLAYLVEVGVNTAHGNILQDLFVFEARIETNEVVPEMKAGEQRYFQLKARSAYFQSSRPLVVHHARFNVLQADRESVSIESVQIDGHDLHSRGDFLKTHDNVVFGCRLEVNPHK